MNASLTTQLQELQEMNSTKDTELSTLRDENKTIKSELQETLSDLQDLRELNKQLTEDKEDKDNLRNQIAILEEKLMKRNAVNIVFTNQGSDMLGNISRDLDSDKSKIDELMEEIRRYQERISELKDNQIKLVEFIKALIIYIQRQSQELKDVKEELKKANEKIYQLQNTIDSQDLDKDKLESELKLRISSILRELEDLKIKSFDDLNKKDEEIAEKSRQVNDVKKKFAKGIGNLAKFMLDNTVKTNSNYFMKLI